MIAASEPQEYIPSGRRQVQRHPGLEDKFLVKKLDAEDVLDKLKKVSLDESKYSERWILRKTPNKLAHVDNDSESEEEEDQLGPPVNFTGNSDFLSDSLSFKTAEASQKFGKRISDSNFSRGSSKRFSGDTSHCRISERANKSGAATSTRAPSANLQQSKFKTKIDVGYMEDELYVKGHTVVWSRGLVTNGSNDNGRKILCSYTSAYSIQHAVWCTFYCASPSYNNLFEMQNEASDEPNGTPMPAICIVDSHNIRVFSSKGDDFIMATPFEIKKIWSTKYGLFIKRSIQEPLKNFEENKATLYSLASPLDDVCPVAINNAGVLQLLNNNNLIVIYTIENPSICLLYDSVSKKHLLYRIRKIRTNERLEFTDKNDTTCASSATNRSNRLRSRLSMWENLKNNHLNVPTPTNRSASVANLHSTKSQNSMATISRGQSPAVSLTSSWLMKQSRLHTSSKFCESEQLPINQSFFDCSRSMSYLNASPMICLDFIWSEETSEDDNASKVFLADDLTGHWYFCYILSIKNQLVITLIDFTNPSSIIVGGSTRLNARDAAPIPHLHMTAVLEHNSNVTLYSGLTVVGKLHMGGTLVQHIPSPYIRRTLPKFNSPFPKRSSLLPHAKADPKFDDHLLSPVLPESSQRKVSNVLKLNDIPTDVDPARAVLNGLLDPIENRITLRYSDGTCYRITIPSLATNTLVESCLKTLRECLPKEAATVVLTRWYVARNGLGNEEINTEQEWDIFKKLLLELLGYEVSDDETTKDCPVTPCPKRQKPSSVGCDDDWLYLTKSNYNKLDPFLNNVLKIKNASKNKNKKPLAVLKNTKSILFPKIKLIHQCLHILFEDLKLNILRSSDLKFLAELLSTLAYDLGLVEYCVYYWKEFPDLSAISDGSQLPTEVRNLGISSSEKPLSIMEFVYNLITGKSVTVWPYLKGTNKRSRNVIQICGLIAKEFYNIDPESLVRKIDLNSSNPENPKIFNKTSIATGTIPEQVTLLMAEKKITVRELDTFPVAIYLLFYGALWKCRENPPSGWPAEAYYLLWRDDLAAQSKVMDKDKTVLKHEMYSSNQLQGIISSMKSSDNDQSDGMEDLDNAIMKLRFSEDMRVTEVRKMLQSSKPVPIVLTQRPDVSDHDFIEEQEKHLYAICTRTLALPTGRGMVSLRTSTPVITEPLPTSPLTLTGKVPSLGTTVELNHIDTPPNMNLWPLFHNGVASGLRITPDAHNIDNTWIIFNKPKGAGDTLSNSIEHAGFLMALGLNGHLKNLHVLNTYDYLVKFQEMTSIGILLGLSAAFRGTSNPNLTKTLSIHVEALLPPTSMELDVPQNLQVAALLGVGMVYQGTAHRHIIDVLLSEIGRPPGPEMENSVDRESYSLAAGLSLGLVTLRQGGRPSGLSDMNVSDTLHYYMVGGNRRPLTGPQKDKYKVSSFQIREGSTINLDVTAPGATIALGLMYLGTGNKAVADWMAPPETQYLLDFVRPDFLMFRILSRALIMWNDIEPSKDWVENQVPATIRPYCLVTPSSNLDIDYEAMNQAYCNIVTGACFGLGLKFAGTADKDAFETLLHFCHMFTKLTVKSIAELAGKPTIETCLNVVLLSAAMVMAGTGNLEIIRLVRHLRRRVGVGSSNVVTYGSHLAIHMALGLLFLGGGRYTLSNSPANVAALICAFYPKFPTHSNDNRYHLQAFRHLYVLAVEPRLIIPRDVTTGKSCYASLRIVKLDGSVLKMKGPDIIPDLNTLLKVAVDDERYWTVVFERGRNWNLLIKILSTTGYVEVKQRAGCLSYIVDKYGYHSQLARTLTQSGVVPWDPPSSSIVSFTFDPAIKLFCDHYLRFDSQATSSEIKLKQRITRTAYEAVIRDKLIIVPVFATLFKMMQTLRTNPTPSNLWQFKLISAQVLKKPLSSNLLPNYEVLALEQEFQDILDSWKKQLSAPLESYLCGANLTNFSEDILNKLAICTCYYDLKFKSGFAQGEPLQILSACDLPFKTVKQIMKN